ncbi:hypothetical protein MALU111345_19165 [Marinicrinis lubricantis]
MNMILEKDGFYCIGPWKGYDKKIIDHSNNFYIELTKILNLFNIPPLT